MKTRFWDITKPLLGKIKINLEVYVLVQVFGVLLVTMYVFAAFGVDYFGGKLYRGNPKLIGTAYDTSDYYAFNCNDFGSCMLISFELLIVNNWTVSKSGFAAVTSPYATW